MRFFFALNGGLKASKPTLQEYGRRTQEMVEKKRAQVKEITGFIDERLPVITDGVQTVEQMLDKFVNKRLQGFEPVDKKAKPAASSMIKKDEKKKKEKKAGKKAKSPKKKKKEKSKKKEKKKNKKSSSSSEDSSSSSDSSDGAKKAKKRKKNEDNAGASGSNDKSKDLADESESEKCNEEGWPELSAEQQDSFKAWFSEQKLKKHKELNELMDSTISKAEEAQASNNKADSRAAMEKIKRLKAKFNGLDTSEHMRKEAWKFLQSQT
eukprot:gnl/MRDRNA2_/MRDRNA2_78288_c0_seq2.p1 gnl/MRDRNA2_/MRDRNA2_78288_c0~~gnl/MRDRNA2_/MRDRNA2_78288_c0_seq2.p1  ORF type:complete len:266 (-),score=96.75 gnl/MRDRNA2_/MRDRNA2_78288_c0_seq2:20-817(-)